jgi:hypothetical protein
MEFTMISISHWVMFEANYSYPLIQHAANNLGNYLGGTQSGSLANYQGAGLQGMRQGAANAFYQKQNFAPKLD